MTTPAKPALPEPDAYMPARHAIDCALFDPSPGNCDCGRRGPPLWGVKKVRTAIDAAVAEAQRELGECTGGYQTLEREVADLKRQLAEARGVPVVSAERISDLICEHAPAMYHCLRVWSAWTVGTMSEDDFEPVAGSDWPNEIAEQIVAMLSATPSPTEPAMLNGLTEDETAATASVAGLSSAEPAMPAERPIDMILYCPNCGMQHIDAPEFNGTREDKFPAFGEDPAMSWTNPPHRSHLCHGCGCIWRPADVPTNGVAEIKTEGKADSWPVNAAVAKARGVPALTDDMLRYAMEYKVVTASNPESLAEKVRTAIAEGWEPCGGVAVAGWYEQWENSRKGYTESQTETMFCQAVVLRA